MKTTKKTKKQQLRERDEAIRSEASSFALPPLQVEIVNAAGEVARVMEVPDPRAMWCANFNELWRGSEFSARPKISA